MGLLLLFGGILLLLALLSFDLRDVPSWAFGKYTPITEHPSNVVGRVGAIVARMMYLLFGGASFFAAVGLLGLGIATFTGKCDRLGIRFGWAFVFVLSWSTLLDLQHVILLGWKQKFDIPGPGGWFGHQIDLALGRNVLGTAGSALIFIALALISLILATGFHPVLALRRFVSALGSGMVQLFALLRKDSSREGIDLLNTTAPNPIATSRVRRKASLFSGESESMALASGISSSEMPAPKIIDASVPSPSRKPTLAEVMKGRANTYAPPSTLGSAEGGLSDVRLEGYILPKLELLETHDNKEHQPVDPAELQGVQRVLIDTLAEFGIVASPGDITKGPTITRYEVYPATGVRVERISALEKNLARATSAERITILAPIPGKDTVGIEIANSKKVKVAIRELFESEAWETTKAKLPLALGKDVYGNAIIADLAAMPHLLVAGATGSGKSVCINSIITSLIFRHTPEHLRFIMIDPKVVEMQVYNKLPHLVTPVVTDPKKVLLALRWVIDEMELRYRIFAKVGVRNVTGFNGRPQLEKEIIPEVVQVDEDSEKIVESDMLINPEELLPEGISEPIPVRSPRSDDDLQVPDHMPFIVVIVDELADLMQTAPADVEAAIARITQMARAAGIHMIVATQTPRADVVTGIIKANIPTRIAFQVASKIDSRVILDENGAERLLGQGDMLYLPPGSAKFTRAQGVLVTDEEIQRVVDNLAAQSKPVFEPSILAKLSGAIMPEEDITDAEEELVEKCLEIIRQEGKASTSMLQRRLRLGYTRAARVVDILEQRGILGSKDGAKDREILIDLGSLDDAGNQF